MAKPVKAQIKLQLPAGKAAPSQQVGTALGPHGLNIMEFCKAFNEGTKDMGDAVVPVIITIFDDRTFSLQYKKPPVADSIKKVLKLQKGAGDPLRNKIGKLSVKQVEEIAANKMEDLNANDLEAAKKIVVGTARSMGVEVEK